jgi:transcriptional regulator with XRE-family HTH domain
MGFGTGASPDHRAAESQIEDEMLALITQLTNEITWHMRERGLTRADLAARMGVSPGRVSQILGGGENLTLRTLAALSTALDARFDVELTALKSGDSYTPARTGATATGNHHAVPRARHREARLGR